MRLTPVPLNRCLVNRCLAFGAFSFICCFVAAFPCSADDAHPEPASQSVIVQIRTVRASGADAKVIKRALIEAPSVQNNSSLQTFAAPQAKRDGSQPEVDEGLSDLRSKLSKLHYKAFKLICSQEAVVPLMKKRTLYLAEGNSVTVRPMYMADDKIGVWLRWLDGAGTRILDTRVHFEPGETMLTGMDDTGDTGTILAIDVKPAP